MAKNSNQGSAREGAPRRPEKPGQVAGRMAALRERRKDAGQHRVELWLTAAEEKTIRGILSGLRR